MGNNGTNRTGGTSRRSGNPPVVTFSTDFHPKSEPPKPFDHNDLDQHISARGFAVDSPELARYFLERISYQHASSYFHLFLDEEGGVVKNTPVSCLNRVILFDRKLQSILLEYIGLFELQFRAQYSYLMSAEGGAFAHRNPANFKDLSHFESFLKSYGDEISRQMRSGNDIISASLCKYGDAPIWQAVEVMSFGTLSKLYMNTKSKLVVHGVADSFGVRSSQLISWMRSLSFVRNRCAHFGALLGQPIPAKPSSIPGVTCGNDGAFYSILLLEKLLFPHEILLEYPYTAFGFMLAQEVTDLFNEFSDVLDIAGIPEHWDKLILCEQITGVEVLTNPSDDGDGKFWFVLGESGSNRLIKFTRWGARLVER